MSGAQGILMNKKTNGKILKIDRNRKLEILCRIDTYTAPTDLAFTSWPFSQGTNLVLGPPEKFYRRNPSGTFRDVHWYHLGDPKKVPGAPSQGFLTFLGFDKNSTKIEIWLSYPHFSADFQVPYHFGKLLTARSQGITASKNQSIDQ